MKRIMVKKALLLFLPSCRDIEIDIALLGGLLSAQLLWIAKPNFHAFRSDQYICCIHFVFRVNIKPIHFNVID